MNLSCICFLIEIASTALNPFAHSANEAFNFGNSNSLFDDKSGESDFILLIDLRSFPVDNINSFVSSESEFNDLRNERRSSLLPNFLIARLFKKELVHGGK